MGFQKGIWLVVLLAFLSDNPPGGSEGRWDRGRLREAGHYLRRGVEGVRMKWA